MEALIWMIRNKHARGTVKVRKLGDEPRQARLGGTDMSKED